MRAFTHIIKFVINPVRFGFLHFMAAKCTTSPQRKKLLTSGLFDADFYVARYGSVSSLVARDPLKYYVTTGWRQGHDPSPNFCNNDYMHRCQHGRIDTGITISPLEHYVFWGCRHKCEPASLASIDMYIKQSVAQYEQYTEWSKTQQHPCLLFTHELTTTGAPFALMNMAIALKKQGYSPLIMSPKDGRLSKELERNGIPYVIDTIIGIRYFEQTHDALQTFLNSFDFIVFNTIICMCWLDTMPAISTKKICWLHEGKVVVTDKLLQDAMSGALAQMDRIYAVNRYTADMVCRHTKCSKLQIHTLPYGLHDTSHVIPTTTQSDKLLIMFPGMISVRKGHHVMVRALKLLPKDVQEHCEIHVVGPHPEDNSDPAYKQLIQCQSPSLKIIGELSHDDFIAYIDHADIIICPSLDDPLPIVCSEAFCNSKPVIVSDGTGTANLIENGVDGFVVPANSPKKLADIITHVTRHRNDLPAIGARGRAIFDKNFKMSMFEANVARMVRDTIQRPLISVIVTSYNYEHLIKETLDSIINQSYTNIEIIVVDDGSKDNSMQVIQDYCNKDPRVHLYTHPGNENYGLPKTLQLAVEKSQGEYIAFCESDDVWTPNNLEKKVALIKQHGDATIISNDIEIFGEANDTFKSRFDTYLNEIRRAVRPGGCHCDINKRPLFNFIPTFSCVCVRRNILEDIDWGTPINAWIDLWLWRQVLVNHKLYYIDAPLTRWRIHKDSFNGSSSVLHDRLSHYLIYLSNVLLKQSQTFDDWYINDTVMADIKQRKLFDIDYYLQHYSFAHYTDDDAFYHYILSGWRLGYNPSAQFDTVSYITKHETQMPVNTCPLLYYYYTEISADGKYPPKWKRKQSLIKAFKDANHRRLERRKARNNGNT